MTCHYFKKETEQFEIQHMNKLRHEVTHANITSRRGSRINTDRFPKWAPKAQASSGVQEWAPPGKNLDFYSLKSPFLGFQVIQRGYWRDGNLKSLFIIKNILIMKI